MNFLRKFDTHNNVILYNQYTNTQNSEIILDETEDTIYNQNQTYCIIINSEDIKILSAFLKLHSITRVSGAIDITVVDKINNKLRFNVNYQLLSITTNTRYIISTFISENTSLLSLQTLYPAFNWAEREVWDMYGIFISKHPDLRRILTDYGFIGFPLRKDFPLSGFKEVQYEDAIKQVEYCNTELTQSYRLLSFMSTWS